MVNIDIFQIMYTSSLPRLALKITEQCNLYPIARYESWTVHRYELQRGTSVTSSQMDDSEQPPVIAIDLGNGDHMSVSQ